MFVAPLLFVERKATRHFGNKVTLRRSMSPKKLIMINRRTPNFVMRSDRRAARVREPFLKSKVRGSGMLLLGRRDALSRPTHRYLNCTRVRVDSRCRLVKWEDQSCLSTP